MLDDQFLGIMDAGEVERSAMSMSECVMSSPMFDIHLGELHLNVERIMKDTVSQAEKLGLSISNMKQLAAVTRPVFGSHVHVMSPENVQNSGLRENYDAYVDVFLNRPMEEVNSTLVFQYLS